MPDALGHPQHISICGEIPAWPQRDRQLPGCSVFRISSCGTPGSANPFLAPQPSARTHLDLFLQEFFKGLMGSTTPQEQRGVGWVLTRTHCSV